MFRHENNNGGNEGGHDERGYMPQPPPPSSGGGGGGGGGGGYRPPCIEDQDDDGAMRMMILSGPPPPPLHPPSSIAGRYRGGRGGLVGGGLEVLPEEDAASIGNNGAGGGGHYPRPPPHPSLLLVDRCAQGNAIASSSAAATSGGHMLPPPPPPPPPPPQAPPPTSGVWSVFVASSSKEDNAHVIRFYLDRVFTNAREVIAFICGFIVVILMILCLASPDWLLADKFRQGLWVHCIAEDAAAPLPFNLTDRGGCFSVRSVGYIQTSAAFCVLCLLVDLAATAMTAGGLYSKDPLLKYRLYRYAVYAMIVALVFILIALIVYPSCFAAEIDAGNRRVWEFGWAYGVGWGAAIFLFGAVVLLLCDKETEEIYYKERTIIHDNGHESKA